MSSLVVIPPLHENTRYKQLDSLRGIAALFVFLSHYVGIFNPPLPYLDRLQKTPLGILINGHAAVMFFFTLSGFVLGLPYIKDDRPLKLTEFYVKRIFRIYPAYWMAILLAVALKYFLFDKTHMHDFSPWVNGFWNWGWDRSSIKEIIRTFGIVAPRFDNNFIDPVIWSLVIEMRMSFLLPFLIVLAAKINARLCIGLLIIVLVASNYGSLIQSLPVFLLGVILGKFRGELSTLVNRRSRLTVVLLFLVALLLYNSNFEYFHIDPAPGEPLFRYYLRDFIMGIGSCILIVIVISKARHFQFLQRRPFLLLGEISYSFYLLQLPVLFVTCSLLRNVSTMSYFYILVISLLVIVGLSILLYNTIEIPFQKLAKRIIKRYPILDSLSLNDR